MMRRESMEGKRERGKRTKKKKVLKKKEGDNEKIEEWEHSSRDRLARGER